MTAQHLTLAELTLLPSGEWFPKGEGWVVARISEGSGYWLQREGARQLGTGDLVVAARNWQGAIRASSLGPLGLQYFFVQTRFLSGIISVMEAKQLEIREHGGGPAQVLGANEIPARKFSDLAVSGARSNQLTWRCRLLQIWTDALQESTVPKLEAEDDPVRARLKHFLGEIPEAELASCSLSDLAERLHCSARHFSRVFREEAGVPFREHQRRMRLSRAGRILAESDAKVIQAAYDSGYRHLGLFNTMFKKHFGMTPTEWRARARGGRGDFRALKRGSVKGLKGWSMKG
jgi:AraC-like DNA-binding protein